MTQLQDHIVMLLHEFYEDNRKKIKKKYGNGIIKVMNSLQIIWVIYCIT